MIDRAKAFIPDHVPYDNPITKAWVEIMVKFAQSELDRAWVEIKSVEDLPEAEGSFLWEFAELASLSRYKVQHFNPRLSNDLDYFSTMYIRWMPIPPYQPQGEGE